MFWCGLRKPEGSKRSASSCLFQVTYATIFYPVFTIHANLSNGQLQVYKCTCRYCTQKVSERILPNNYEEQMKSGKKKSFTCIWNVVKLFESVLGKMPGDHYILCWIVKNKLYRCSRPKNANVPLLLKKVFNIFARISFFLFQI